jgi:hypothetical protein
MSNVIHRADTSVLEQYLPVKSEYSVYIRMSPFQRKLYVEMIKSERNEAGKGTRCVVDTSAVVYSTHPLLILYSSSTHPLLLLYACSTPALLTLYSPSTHPLLILYSSSTHPLLLLYSCSTQPHEAAVCVAAGVDLASLPADATGGGGRTGGQCMM